MRLCECGCGQEVPKANKFILGHSFKGRHHNKEVRQRISEVRKQLLAEGKIISGQKPRLANVPKEELTDLYWGKQLSLQEVGKIYGVTSTTIMKRMKVLSIPRRVIHGFLKDVTREQLVHLYNKQHLTTYDIAKMYNVDPSSIWERMRHLGITLRQSGGRKRGVIGKGWHKTGHGYIRCLMPDNSPYTTMARPDGYVLEHRLRMAEHLVRCLLPREVVHHINGVKDDNRIENLEVFSSTASHSVFNNACRECSLRKEIRLLRWQIKEQSEQIKNLTATLMGTGDK